MGQEIPGGYRGLPKRVKPSDKKGGWEDIGFTTDDGLYTVRNENSLMLMYDQTGKYIRKYAPTSPNATTCNKLFTWDDAAEDARRYSEIARKTKRALVWGPKELKVDSTFKIV